MKKHIREINDLRRRYREGPLTYIVSLLDLLVLGLIAGGLYWLLRSPEASLPEQESEDTEVQAPIASIEQANSPSEDYAVVEHESAQRFIKIASNGDKLPDESDVWSCVLDTQTSMIWEVKPNDGSWRDKEHTYSWFKDAKDASKGKQDAGRCSYISCDTKAYTNSLNLEHYCGFNDWRLPEQKEFETLDHETNYFPDIDTRYFPNTMSGQYWTRTENKFSKTLAWSYDFSNGISYVSEKRLQFHVRGVRR